MESGECSTRRAGSLAFRCDTRVSHLSVESGSSSRESRVRRVEEFERQVLVEKAKLLAEGELREGYTAYLSLRVRPTIKQLWNAAPIQAKRAAKHALEAAILAYYLGGQASMNTPSYHAPPIIMNLNIVEAKAESRSEAKIDLKPIIDLLEELMREIQIIHNLASYPSQTNMSAITQKSSEIIAKIREMREKLLFN